MVFKNVPAVDLFGMEMVNKVTVEQVLRSRVSNRREE
jgi:hypothetical protein